MGMGFAVRGKPGAPVIVTISAIGALAIASVVWVYGTNVITGDLIRSDATGYYMYLPAVLIDHDVTMIRTQQRSFPNEPGDMAGIKPVPPHNYLLDQFPIGEAVMILPFFGVAEVTALAAGTSTEGFSWPYQVATTAAGLSYALIGLALLSSVLLRWFSRRTVIITLLGMTFGTDLFHYATIDANFSHAFSFALVALILKLTLSIWESPRAVTVLGLGGALGLLTLVRPSNIVLVVFCALIGVERPSAVLRRARALVQRRDLVALGMAVFLLSLIPQSAYWYAITGKAWVYAYQGEAHFDYFRPHVLDVLFSVRKGLFFWTPILVLAVAGFALLRRYAPALVLASIAYLGVQTWVVSSWSFWTYGGSFGMRPFVESLPIFALGFAALVERARGITMRRVLNSTIALTTLLAVHGMLAYWTQRIPYDGTTWHQYVQSFF
jgi:hypothetical protein